MKAIQLSVVLAVVAMAILPAEAQNAEGWVLKAPLPRGRYYHGGTPAAGKLYIFGGNDTSGYTGSCDEYDPTTDSWRNRASMPAGMYAMASTSLNGIVYSIGGCDAINGGGQFSIPSAAVYTYDPGSNAWTQRQSLPSARMFLCAKATTDRVYAICGWTSGPINNVDEYDPGTDTWTAVQPYPVSVDLPTGGFINGRIYITGGGAYGTMNNQVYDFNPVTKVWTGGHASHPGQAAYNSVGSVITNRLYVMAGQYYSGTNGNYEYVPSTETWTTRMTIPQPLDFCAGGAIGNKIYLAGSTTQPYTTNYQYTPVQIGQLPNAPANLTQRIPGGPALPAGTWKASHDWIFGADVTDPDLADQVSLQVEVCPDSTPFKGLPTASSPLSAQGVQAVAVTGLGEQGYHWQVRSADQYGNLSAWALFGGAPDFHIGLTSPQGISPVDGFSTKGTSVNFTWTVSTGNVGTLSYELQVARDAGFTKIEVDSVLATPAGTADLKPAIHYWRVRALDSTGMTSGWSTVRRFDLGDTKDNGAGDAVKVCGFSASSGMSSIWGLLAVAAAVIIARRLG